MSPSTGAGRRAAGLLLAGSLVALGCGEASETLSEGERGTSEGTVVKLDTHAGGLEVGERVQLPEGFPRDVPLYPGATAQMAMSGSGEGMVVTLSTEDATGEVFEFYRSKLEDQGWAVEGEMSFGGQRMLQCAKQGRTAMVTITGSDDGSNITLALGEGR